MPILYINYLLLDYKKGPNVYLPLLRKKKKIKINHVTYLKIETIKSKQQPEHLTALRLCERNVLLHVHFMA